MKMKPVTMIKPSKDCVYAPSKIRPDIEVSNQEFTKKCVGETGAILVSFDDDSISNPVETKAYLLPSGWFIAM